jgi:hypothetical protein
MRQIKSAPSHDRTHRPILGDRRKIVAHITRAGDVALGDRGYTSGLSW